MERKVTVATTPEGEAAIKTSKIYLQITMDEDKVILTEKAEIYAGLENPVMMQKPMLSLSGTEVLTAPAENAPQSEQDAYQSKLQLKTLTAAFVADVFALYETYRQAVSPVLKSQNPDNF